LAFAYAAGTDKQFGRIDLELFAPGLLVAVSQGLDRLGHALRAGTDPVVPFLPAIAENHYPCRSAFGRQFESSLGKQFVVIFLGQRLDAKMLAGIQPRSRRFVAPVFFLKAEWLAAVLPRGPLALSCRERQHDARRGSGG
jgi:hypothetical protein